jgi:hypothetical protein
VRSLLPASAAAALALSPCVTRADVVHPDRFEQRDQTSPFRSVDERRMGLATTTLFFRYAHTRDAAALSGLSDVFVGGFSTRAAYGKRLGYAFGLDLSLGGGGAPGFAYDAHLFPLGAALALGPTGFLGVFGGIGSDGVTARIPGTLTLPAELRLELDVTRRARLGALFAVAWAPLAPARRGGSTLLPFADETTMALSARFGKTFPREGANMGRGYFFRLERREQRKTILLGLAFGVEIDVAY